MLDAFPWEPEKSLIVLCQIEGPERSAVSVPGAACVMEQLIQGTCYLRSALLLIERAEVLYLIDTRAHEGAYHAPKIPRSPTGEKSRVAAISDEQPDIFCIIRIFSFYLASVTKFDDDFLSCALVRIEGSYFHDPSTAVPCGHGLNDNCAGFVEEI